MTMTGWIPPLLADGETWLKLTFAAVAGLIWLVNQLVSNAKKQAPPQAPQPMPPQRPQPGLEDVQDFLRRAAEQRQREAQKPPQPPRQKQQRSAQKKGPPQVPNKPKPLGKPLAKPLTAEIVEDPMRERSVGAHVQKHLDTKVFQERTSHLSQVAAAPSQIDSHLHQVFDHNVGRLTTGTESDDDPATEGPVSAMVPAAAIAKLLSNPESAKQAFILGEIFRRPDGLR